ncbi:MAG: AMP-binding protein [Gemmatimonadota bacterium]|nr:AMP-binding protein [Gemmatimonadota bacterium]
MTSDRGRPDPSPDRQDLLATLSRYRRESDRDVRRVDRWRRRGWSRTEIAAEAERVAGALHDAGIERKERVALWLSDGPLWHAAFFGVLRAGAVVVPLDLSLETEFVRERAEELEIAAWITERHVPRLELDRPAVPMAWSPPEPVHDPPGPPARPPGDPDRTAEIVLTSGTSGAPKAVPVSHRNLLAVLNALEEGIEEYRWALRLAPPMRLAVALPLSHLYGQVMGVFVPSLLDADATMIPTMPAPDLARRLRQEGAWALATVPRTIELLGRHLRARGEERWGAEGFDSRLREAAEQPWWRRLATFAPLRRELGLRFLAVVSGGAALDREVEELWRTLGYAVVQGYGLTETAPLVTLNHPFDSAPGSLGRPLPGVDVRIDDDGEILVRGPNVVASRLGGPAVDAEGWLHTGDLGEIDAAGRLRYRGRRGERIVTPAGVNVDPGPVVEALRERDDVLDAVVLERPWGERGVVTAVVLVRPGADPAGAVRSANEDLPDAARIRDWHVWPEVDFPRTATGKPRRPEILGWLRERAPEESERGEREAGAPPPGPSDARDLVRREVADVAGRDASEIDADDRIADLLGSLDRVELVTRLETTYGTLLPPEVLGEERTVGELADELAAILGEEREAPEEEAERGPGPAGEAERGGTAERARIRETAAPPVERPPDRGEFPRARWRSLSPVRALRFAIREAAMRALVRSFLDLDAGGTDALEELEPPFLVAANHQSEFDPAPILFGLPAPIRARIATTAMWEFFEEARFGPAWYRLGVLGLNLVPLVQRGDWRPTLEIAGEVADAGGCPLVFPEGERTKDGSLLEFRRGVAVLARDLHLPIVPCAIDGLLEVLPKGAHWPRNCWTHRAPVAARFGEPIAAPRPDDEIDEVVAELRRRIAALLGAARASLR